MGLLYLLRKGTLLKWSGLKLLPASQILGV